MSKKDKKIKKKKSKVAKIIWLVILIIILLAGGVFAFKVHKNGGGLSGILATVFGNNEQTLESLDKMYCVVMGKSMNLTDTIMLVSYEPKTQQASMLSIPRDTYVGKSKTSATASKKINALYQIDVEKTMQAIRDITGIEVYNYVVIDTEALIDLVDEIGGVYFDVPVDMDYDDSTQDLHIHAKKGYQLLDGQTAEEVVRFRHNNDGSTYPDEYGQQDIGRMKTQRNFLTSLAKQTLKASNILKINDFIDIAKKNVETNVNFEIVKKYVPYAVSFNVDSLRTGTLPGEPEKCNGVWIYTYDKDETTVLVNDLFNSNIVEDNDELEENTVTETQTQSKTQTNNITIEIINGTGNVENAKKVKKSLESKGYIVSTIKNSTSTVSKTMVINRNDKESSVLKDIVKTIGIGKTTTSSIKSNVDVTINLGKDYK